MTQPVKLWTVEVERSWVIVVAADNEHQACTIAQEAADDGNVDYDTFADARELTDREMVPAHWRDCEPECDLGGDLYDRVEAIEQALGLNEEERYGMATVDRLLWLAEELAKREVQRCPNTPDMFDVADPSKVSADRQPDGSGSEGKR